MKSAHRAFPVDEKESGFIMVAMVIILLPLTLVVAAFMSSMTGRSLRLREEVVQEKALLAAESGLDHAIYVSRTSGLTDGDMLVRAFGRGMAFSVEPTYMGGDGLDNDSDGDTDEADEDVFQVIIRGTYRGATRRLAAYLGSTPILPAVESAVSLHNPNVEITLQGSPKFSGIDTNMDESPGNPANDLPGMTIAAPGTVADLLGELSASEQSKIHGVGGTPSLAVSSPIDLDTLVAEARNSASIVLTNNLYDTFDFGDASAGTSYITFREGDVKFAGNSRGAGLLVVTGNLELVGTFRFDGIIVVLGNIDNSAGTAEIYGGLVQGPAATQLTFKGTSDVYFSDQALQIAYTVSSRYVAFNGWQEISRK
jgi:hypothetical protein